MKFERPQQHIVEFKAAQLDMLHNALLHNALLHNALLIRTCRGCRLGGHPLTGRQARDPDLDENEELNLRPCGVGHRL